MKNRSRRAFIVPILCVFCLLSACTTTPPETAAPVSEGPETVLGRLPEEILTAAVVGDTVGVPMEEGVVEEDGRCLSFTAEDGVGRVVISLEEAGRQYYDDLVAVCFDPESVEPIEALGESALWSPATEEVLAYDREHIVSVWTAVEGVDPRDVGIRLMSVVLLNLSLSA